MKNVARAGLAPHHAVTVAGGALTPIVVRTTTIHAPITPVAYDRVKLIAVRSGSAILLSEFGEKPVSAGDVILLSASTLCGSEPEHAVTVTTIYLDRDYVADQVFWQYAHLLTDRWAAQDILAKLFCPPAQILRLGKQRLGMIMPWLDELTTLSLDRPAPERFYRAQALLFAVLDVIAPYVTTTPTPPPSIQRGTTRRGAPEIRQLAPLREEVRTVIDLLRDAPAKRWTLRELAAAVHLSPSQLGRVFVQTYGKTPLGCLATIRVENLTRLLRQTDLPIEAAMREVGWHSRGHAARVFREAVGVTPSRYRRLVHEGPSTGHSHLPIGGQQSCPLTGTTL